LIANAFCENGVLKSLDIGANITNKPPKKGYENIAFQSLIDLIESDCPLGIFFPLFIFIFNSLKESLSIRGSKTIQPRLEDLLPFVYAIGVNESLLSLDISCNGLGNKVSSSSSFFIK